MMNSASRFTAPYARMILAATRQELLLEPKKAKQLDAKPEDIARMERQMEKLYQDYKLVEDTLGESMLVLVVAKGFVARLMRNEAIVAYLDSHHADLARELTSVMDAVANEAQRHSNGNSHRTRVAPDQGGERLHRAPSASTVFFATSTATGI